MWGCRVLGNNNTLAVKGSLPAAWFAAGAFPALRSMNLVLDSLSGSNQTSRFHDMTSKSAQEHKSVPKDAHCRRTTCVMTSQDQRPKYQVEIASQSSGVVTV